MVAVDQVINYTIFFLYMYFYLLENMFQFQHSQCIEIILDFIEL